MTLPRRPKLFVAILVLIGFTILPLFIGSYYQGLLTKMLIFAVLAMSLDLLLGYTGLPSLGHAAFFGSAAYSVALLSKHVTTNFWIAAGAGVGTALLVAAIFALLALRARGAYFLMITLALGQVIWAIAYDWRALTGGDDGLPGIPRPDLGLPWNLWDTLNFYYFTLLIFLVTAGIMRVIVRSPFGLALVGIRESESRMTVLGYNVWLYKYVAFVLSALFAGIAGILYVYYNNFISPAALSIMPSAEAMLMVILGGPGTLFGPAAGGAAIVFLESLVSGYTERWLLILGVLYVFVMLFAPNGVWPYFARWSGKSVWRI